MWGSAVSNHAAAIRMTTYCINELAQPSPHVRACLPCGAQLNAVTGGRKLTNSAVCEYPTTLRSHTASPQLPDDIVVVELHGEDVPSYDVKPPVDLIVSVNAPTAVAARGADPGQVDIVPYKQITRFIVAVSSLQPQSTLSCDGLPLNPQPDPYWIGHKKGTSHDLPESPRALASESPYLARSL